MKTHRTEDNEEGRQEGEMEVRHVKLLGRFQFSLF
jgi:hypothetical protein